MQEKKIGETSLKYWGKNKTKLLTLKSVKTLKTEGKIKIYFQIYQSWNNFPPAD